MQGQLMRDLSRVMIVLCLSAATAACRDGARSVVDVKAEAEAIRLRSRQLVSAEARNDIDAILAFYDEDAVNQPPGAASARGHDAIRELYVGLSRDVPFVSFTADITEVRVSEAGDLAYEIGVNHLVLDRDGVNVEDIGKYLVVWRKVDGEWLVAAVSFSSDGPEQ